MTLTRRALLASSLAAPIAASGADAAAYGGGVARLPRKEDFFTDGIFLNSAFTHPIGKPVIAAMHDYVQLRLNEPRRMWVTQEVENEAASLFARLINASPTDIAAVPSTMIGENLICASLDLRPGMKIVTDAFHYFASLAKYGEMRKQGLDVTVVAPRGDRIALEDLEAAVTPGTRLVAVSLVSSHTGYIHDLKQVCAIAHRRQALVYADIIQAAGAIPIDVKDSGVDFACSGGYKWLQGDFGAAFLYVRPEALGQLKRVQTGWRQVQDYVEHAFPYNSIGPVEGSWRMADRSAEDLFEVSSPSHSALWSLRASIGYVLGIGVETICDHRRPIMDRLYSGLRDLKFQPLSPQEQHSPIAAFAHSGIDPRIKARCNARKIKIGISDHYVRISPSIFNTVDDIDAVLEAFRV